MLIGFAGKAGAGKDTAGIWARRHLSMYPVALATPIKEMLNAGFGWTMHDWDNREWKDTVQPELGFSPRQAAQELGTKWRNDMGKEDLWCFIAQQRHGHALQRLAITDIRFPHEQNWVHHHGGIVIEIVRPRLSHTDVHVSETSLDSRKVDLVIYNSGSIEELYNLLNASVYPIAVGT